MPSRSILLTSLLALFVTGTAVLGCAAPTANEEDDETVAESSDELSATAAQFVGRYYSSAVAPGQFARLTLKADGTYSAEVDISHVALCITFPCLGPEEGTWRASKRGGKLRLRFRENDAASRWYDAAKSTTELKLTRAGATQTLNTLGANACLDDKDCSASEECGPKHCLMWCEVNDPFCCGPSTCQPKGPPPPPPACGSATCGAGEVCCNSLMGICAKPGEFCAQ